MSLASDLTQMDSTLTALLEYANGVTGASDVSVGDAIHTLGEGYGQGGGGRTVVKSGSVTLDTATGNTNYTIFPSTTINDLDKTKDYIIKVTADDATMDAIKNATLSSSAMFELWRGLPLNVVRQYGGTVSASTYWTGFCRTTSGNCQMTYFNSANYYQCRYLYAGRYKWEIIEI